MAKPYITKKHCIIEIISYVMMLASFILAIIGMVVLPEEIATHFDGAGNVDGYGSPTVLIILPIIMFLCNGMTSLILHFLPPDAWNTPCKILPGQEIIVYRDMASMIVWMEFEIAAFTLLDTIATYFQSGRWILVSVAVLIISMTITITYEIVMILRHSKGKK